MRNMPKVIGTGKDIYNLLGMVQAGKLAAGELSEAIQGIEDKRYVTTNYLAEAQKGAKVLCEGKVYTIKSVEHITEEAAAEEGETEAEQREDKKTVIGVNDDLKEATEKVGIENPVSVLERIGITQEELDSIKGVLAKYE